MKIKTVVLVWCAIIGTHFALFVNLKAHLNLHKNWLVFKFLLKRQKKILIFVFLSFPASFSLHTTLEPIG